MAPWRGVSVSLTSSDPSVVGVPSTVKVPFFQKSVKFTVTTKAVSVQRVVTISASYGGITKTAVLTVNPAPPAITGHPASRTVTEGQTATFTVTATGSGLSYQWQRSNNGGGTWTGVGTNAASYTTAATLMSDSGAQFRCVVTNPAGSATSNTAVLTVSQTSQPSFTVVVLPDTQFYSESYPATFTAQTQWIVGQLAARNIVFVTHLGDVVNVATTESQWVNADSALTVLDGRVPYGLAPGNHDLTDTPPGTHFNAHFPFTRYAGQPWYGGHYGSGNLNSYQTFNASAMQFLILHLQYGPSSAVLAWADGVVDAHPGYRVIVSTHDYLNVDGTRDANGNAIWNGLVDDNCSVFLVLAGHNHGAARRTDANSCGDTVHQVLQDYQSLSSGGSGFLRYFEFQPATDEIDVYTYSPTLGSFRTGVDQFTLAYDMG